MKCIFFRWGYWSKSRYDLDCSSDLPGSVGRQNQFSRSSAVRHNQPLSHHSMPLSSCAKMDGKPIHEHTRHNVYQCNQRRAPRAFNANDHKVASMWSGFLTAAWIRLVCARSMTVRIARSATPFWWCAPTQLIVIPSASFLISSSNSVALNLPLMGYYSPMLFSYNASPSMFLDLDSWKGTLGFRC